MSGKLKKTVWTVFFAFLSVSVAMPLARAQTSQDTLNQYIAGLQKSPDDQALREKIIKLAQEMKPAPAVPEEARRHYVKASTLLEDAKQPSDSVDAAEEFRQALLIAPWWGEAYMKMGLALETAQRYDDAIASLKLFMATNPKDDVLRKAQDEIYKIEAKQEKAAKESSPEVVAAQERKNSEDLLRKINGSRYVYRYHGTIAMTGAPADFMNTLDVVGDTLVGGQGLASGQDWFKNGINYKIDGLKLHCYVEGQAMPQGDGVLADDGSMIRFGEQIYQRER